VLGADGFIGSHVVATAIATGAEVTGLCVKEPWRLEGSAEGVELIPVRDGRWWEEDQLAELELVLRGVDALAFLAYQPPPSREADAWTEHELSVNTAGARRVAERAVAAGTRVVFTSSADVYGPWHDELVGETHEPSPATPYAHAKLEAERAILAGSPASPGAVCLRLATVYGPGDNGPRAIPSFARALLRGEEPMIHGDGSDVRDYVHVRDVAGAIANACSPPETDAGDPVLNVGSGVGRSTNEILEAVAAAVGARPRARYVPSPRLPTRLVLSTERAARNLGIASHAQFEPALEEEVGWLRATLEDSPRQRA
jgi:UDP-glucose 4-epimerase